MNPLVIPTDKQLDEMLTELNKAALIIKQFKEGIKPLREVYINPEEVTPNDYVEVVCAAHGLDVKEIQANNRGRKYAWVRHSLCYLLHRDFSDRKYPVRLLMDALKRDRSILYNGYKTAKNLITTSDPYFLKVHNISEQAINYFIINKKQQQNNE